MEDPEIISDAHAKALKVLKENRKKLDEVAKTLLTKETLEGEEFIKIMSAKNPAPSKKKTISKAKK